MQKRTWIFNPREWKPLSLPVLVLLIGCNANPSAPDNRESPIARIEIKSAKSEFWLTDTLTIAADLFATDGTPIHDRPITWTSSNPDQLAISAEGFVEANAVGEAMITARSEGVSASKSFKIFTYELVYEVAINRQPTLYSLSIDGNGEPQQLTGLEPYAYEPAASPDGKTIIYTAVDENLNSELYVYDLQTQTSERLTNNPNIDDMAAWHPHDSKIAFRSNTQGRTEDIVVYDFTSNSTVNLTLDPPGIAIEDRQPSWSPDGEKIVFSSYLSGNMDLWIMDADGSNKTQLFSHPGYDTEAAWSPDGAKILFRRWAENGMSLMLYDVETSVVEEINLPGQQRMPAWSPDGRWIAFVSHPELHDRPEIYIARPDGSELELITRDLSWGGGQNPTFRKIQ